MSAFNLLEALLTVTASVIASSGFWAFFARRADKKSATTQLLLGMAHDRIVYLGMKYIQRGWIYRDEYDDFITYLYKPYSNFGGNGLADKIVNEVDNLPLHHRDYIGGINASKPQEPNVRRP